MTLRAEDRERARRRAGYACEFCGVHDERLLEHQTELMERIWRLLEDQQHMEELAFKVTVPECLVR